MVQRRIKPKKIKTSEQSPYNGTVRRAIINQTPRKNFCFERKSLDNIQKKWYHPLFSEMVSKSMCFRVVVHLDSPLENEKVYMHVLDINHNERVYKIIFNDQRITGFEEIR